MTHNENEAKGERGKDQLHISRMVRITHGAIASGRDRDTLGTELRHEKMEGPRNMQADLLICEAGRALEQKVIS